MSHAFLKFNQTDAMKYQLHFVSELIAENKAELQALQHLQQQRMDMKVMVQQTPAVWNTMTQILRPSVQMESMEKTIELQQAVVSFLETKHEALMLMLTDQKCPEVRMAKK